MSNNTMIEYKESFFSKIKSFFRNLFKREKETNNVIQEICDLNDNEIIPNKEESEFFDDLKVDTSDIDKFMDKKNFLEYIDGNVDALNLLSVDRLRKLKQYYDEVIDENDKIIKQLKTNN